MDWNTPPQTQILRNAPATIEFEWFLHFTQRSACEPFPPAIQNMVLRDFALVLPSRG